MKQEKHKKNESTFSTSLRPYLPTCPRAQKGLTLIEVLIAMALMGGIAFLLTRLSGDLTEYSLRFNRGLFTQQQIQQTLQIIVPEIRSASQSSNGVYPIVEATTSTFTFYSDLDKNGTFEEVRYFREDGIFKKGVIEPIGNPPTYPTSSEVVYELVHNIGTSTAIFLYYDNTATSTLSSPLPSPVDVLKIRTVEVNLIANQGTTSTASMVGVDNRATIRNLRYK